MVWLPLGRGAYSALLLRYSMFCGLGGGVRRLWTHDIGYEARGGMSGAYAPPHDWRHCKGDMRTIILGILKEDLGPSSPQPDQYNVAP